MIVCVLWLSLTVPWVSLQCVIVAFSGHTHLHFFFKHHLAINWINYFQRTIGIKTVYEAVAKMVKKSKLPRPERPRIRAVSPEPSLLANKQNMEIDVYSDRRSGIKITMSH